MPINVLERARSKGVELSVADGRLKVRAKPGALDDELRQEISRMKGQLIDLISDIQLSTLDQDAQAIARVARDPAGSPLSFAQQRLWFIDKHEDGSRQYNIPTALTLRGALNKIALQQALDALLERHEVLRTTYAEVDESAVQVVNAATRFPITEVDLSNIDAASQASQVQELVRHEANLAFDLRRDLVLRASLVKLSGTQHVLLFTMHHIASDGWSVGVLTREFAALYGAFCQGKQSPLEPLEIQYADFAHWQRDTLRDDAIASQLAYWERELAGIPTVHRLPLDRARPAEQDFNGRTFSQHLDPGLRSQLNALAQEHGATLFMLLESAFALLLARWSHQDDVVIGTPIAGRTHSQLEPLIGFFVNTLVFRHQLDGDQSFIQLLLDAKQKALNAYANQDVPFDMVVEKLHPKRSLGHSPLFQVLFALQNNERASLDLPDLSIEALTGGQETIKFDLELAIGENDAGLWLSWTYACSLFDAATIERMSRSFEVLLRSIVAAPDTAIYRLELATDADREQQAGLLVPGSGAEETCLHHLFEKQVERQPQAKAVIFEDTNLSYQELNERANRVAHWLIAQGAKPDTLVGLCLERSIEMVVGILAVWKAGAAYLPIDPAYPQSRVDYILHDSAADIVLTSARVADLHDFKVGKTLLLDDQRAISNFPSGNPQVDGLAVSHLAYVIYTSGSTGHPKGVCIEHRSLSHLSRHLDEITGRPALWAWMASYVFDASLQGLTRFGHGGCLLVLEDQHKVDIGQLAQVLDKHPVDIVDCTPSIVESWLNQDAAALLPDLIIGGEAISPALWQRLHEWQHAYQRTALNVYGPTECCVDSTWTVVAGDMPHVGKALGDTALRILSRGGQPLPMGIPGELHIGGVGLARGYLNRPDLTADKFVDAGPSERMYRTGDLVRWLGDGNLEFLGRLDDQVKIRGFRIELGEIEQQLTRLDAVQASAVLAVEGEANQKRLVAYVVPSQPIGGDFSETDYINALRTSLEQSLAAYMVPSAFKVLPRLPLTPNGKLDKRSLAQLDASAQFEDLYAAPRNPTEAALCEIWQTLLQVEKVGIHDNFFQLGGDSILSIQVVARANKAGIPLTTRQLFASQTIAELALGVAGESGTVAAPQHAVEGGLTLLPIQKSFLSLDKDHVNHFNQTVLLVTPQAFDLRALKKIVGSVYRRHDALRLRFQTDGHGGWVATHAPLTEQMVEDSCVVEPLPPDAEDIGRYITQRCEHYQRTIDIGQGPLLRAVYFQGVATGRLLLVAHHLVVDGVSWRILLADLEQAFRSHQDGQDVRLAGKTSAFQQWGSALAEYAGSDVLRREKAFWHAQADEPVLPFPMDFAPEQSPRRNTSQVVRLELSVDETTRLLKECPAAYRTNINELLLSAVYLGARRWAGTPGLRIMLEGHGREDIFDTLDTTQTVGWFTTAYPLVLKCDDDQVPNVIRNIKEQYRGIPNKGIGYGVLRHLAADPVLVRAEAEGCSHLLFNYLGQFDQTFSEGALFQFAPESAGTDVDPERRRDHALELNGMVAQGRLLFELSYSDAQFNKHNVEKLAAHIEEGLRSVIAHCAPGDEANQAGHGKGGVLTPSDFPLAKVAPAQLNDWQARYDIDRLYPATSMQQGMLFHSMLDAGAYVSQIYPTFTGILHADHFRQAWQWVVDRYDIFRTVFVGDGEQLHQLVVKSAQIPWYEEDLRPLSEELQAQRFEAYRQQDKALGFDAAQAPMQRISVFQLADNRFKVLWSCHHMLLDGWSTPLVYRDVMVAYQALQDGQPIELPAAAPYANYIAWLQAQDQAAAEDHWRNALSDLRRATPLVLDQIAGERTPGHQSSTVQVSREVSDSLQAFAKRSQTTVNTLVQLAWGLLLHRYSGEKHVVFGATISGRPAAVADVESMVGLFINTVPVRISFEQTDLKLLLSALHKSFQHSNDFGYVPLTQIQAYSPIAGGAPLFDSMMAFENFPIDAAGSASSQSTEHGLAMDGLGADEQTNYKITLVATLQDILTISCRYRGEDFAQGVVERMLEQLVAFLAQLPACDSIEAIVLPEDEFHAQVRRTAAAIDMAVQAQASDAGRLAGEVELPAEVPPRTRTEAAMLEIWQDILSTRISSIHANFFDLGGNSLKAMRVASHVAAHFGVEKSLKALFLHNTIEGLSHYVDGQKQRAREQIPVVDKSGALPLSFRQQPLWVIDQMNGGSAEYNMPIALRLRGELDRDALRRSLGAIVERHAVLRTVYLRTESGPVQVIQPPGPLDLPVLDLTGLTDAAQDEAVAASVRDEATARFDLGRDLLLRLRLLVLGENDHVLLLTMHHIASDGWSISILTSEFVALYSAFREGREAVLPVLEIQYADYAHWQRETLEEELERQWQHCERLLRGAPVVHSLPLDKPRPAQQNFTGAVHTQVIGRDTLSALDALGKRHDATVFMVLQSAFALLLSRWSREQDIVLGSPVAGRTHKQLEGLIGCFVNTVVFRHQLAPGKRFIDLIEDSRQQAVDAFANQDIPLEMLVDRLQPERSLSHNPVVQVMFSLQNQDMGELRLPGLQIEGVGGAAPVTKFDLDVGTTEQDGELQLAWRYATSIFEAATIERMAASFEVLLRAIVTGPERTLQELPLLEARSRQHLLEAFNDTHRPYPSELLIHEMFEAQVVANPDAEAVSYQAESLSYGELNVRANQLAHHLIEYGVKPDDRVGICIGRGLDMVVGLIGILKAGAAYVPLDPSYPPARLAYMLRDSAPVALVAESATLPLLTQASGPVLCLDAPSMRDALALKPTHNPDAKALGLTSAHLAYVIYTSGSTGDPKGVMIEHRSVLNLWSALARQLGTDQSPAQRVALNASIAFDASVQSLAQLLSGACVVVVPQDIRSDGEQFLRYLVQQRIQVLDCTPTQLQLLVAAGLLEADSRSECNRVLVGGEPIPHALAERMAAATGVAFYNVYGPTECTVDSTWCMVKAGTHGYSIGRPLDNTRVYILDEQGQAVPIGVFGEICIGGAGVARGYLNQPALTAERFADDPLVAGARMYKSGDIGRWLADGTIEYLGRNDFQVKVRGFRIELGEIEARLSSCPGVQEAAVVVREDGVGAEMLVAYVVMAQDQALVPSDLRGRLAVDLPEYMLPGLFVAIESFPKTPSGKLDRKALPAPGNGRDEEGYEAPRGEQEEALARIWQALFGLERIGRNDNFFDIGGNSIRAIQTVIQVTKAGLDIKIGDIFKLQTIHAICGAPRGEREETLAGIWQALFGLERVGRDDNFFDLGGNSVRAIQTVVQATKAGLDIKIGEIFKLQTIQAICSASQEVAVESAQEVSEAGSNAGVLSTYQRSVIESEAAAGCWHVQVNVGSEVTETHFRHLVKDVLARREAALAVVITKDDDYRIKPVEVTRELLRTVVEIHDVSAMQADVIATQVDATRVRHEDVLAALEGPLLRASLFVGETSSTALLSVHPALLDATQWDVLSGEFRTACAGAMQ